MPVCLTWLIDGVRDEVLPQLSIVLFLGKLNGFVYIFQFLHDHLQRLPAVTHPTCRGQQNQVIISLGQMYTEVMSRFCTFRSYTSSDVPIKTSLDFNIL